MRVFYTPRYYADIGDTVEIHCNTIRAVRQLYSQLESILC